MTLPLSQFCREAFLSIVLGKDGRVRLCNRYAAGALGLEKPVQAIGRDWSDFDPDDGSITLLIGVLADARNRRTDHLRRLYIVILEKDRDTIRSIKPLTVANGRTCQP